MINVVLTLKKKKKRRKNKKEETWFPNIVSMLVYKTYKQI